MTTAARIDAWSDEGRTRMVPPVRRVQEPPAGQDWAGVAKLAIGATACCWMITNLMIGFVSLTVVVAVSVHL